jgi:hypothetical protein
MIVEDNLNQDVNTEETQVDSGSEPSAEQQNDQEQDSQESTETLNQVENDVPKSIPYDRFKEVNDKYKSVEEKLKSYEEKEQVYEAATLLDQKLQDLKNNDPELYNKFVDAVAGKTNQAQKQQDPIAYVNSLQAEIRQRDATNHYDRLAKDIPQEDRDLFFDSQVAQEFARLTNGNPLQIGNPNFGLGALDKAFSNIKQKYDARNAKLKTSYVEQKKNGSSTPPSQTGGTVKQAPPELAGQARVSYAAELLRAGNKTS